MIASHCSSTRLIDLTKNNVAKTMRTCPWLVLAYDEDRCNSTEKNILVVHRGFFYTHRIVRLLHAMSIKTHIIS